MVKFTGFSNKDKKVSDEKNHVKSKISEVLKDNEINTPEKLKHALGKEAIETKFMQNKNGISGVSFQYNNQAYKGTSLGYKWNDLNKELFNNKKLSNMKLTPDEKKEIEFKEDYNRAIKRVIEKHSEEFRNGNVNPNTDRIFAESGFKKQDNNFIYERDNQKISVSEKPFDFAKNEVSKQLEAHKEREKNYNKLMNTKPKRKPLMFGRKEVEKENKQLLDKQLFAGRPVFRPQDYGLNNRDFHQVSKTIQQKSREENSITQHRQKLSVDEERSKRGRGM